MSLKSKVPKKQRIWILFFLVSCVIFSVAVAGEIRYDKGKRRDPFLPLIGPEGFLASANLSKESFLIEGIIYDPKKGSYAVVGGEIYKEGENVGAAKLIKILPDRVILLQDSGETVIWLREEMVESDKEEAA